MVAVILFIVYTLDIEQSFTKVLKINKLKLNLVPLPSGGEPVPKKSGG